MEFTPEQADAYAKRLQEKLEWEILRDCWRTENGIYAGCDNLYWGNNYTTDKQARQDDPFHWRRYSVKFDHCY